MIFMDIETLSDVNLKSVGTYAYAAHPSTRLMCACLKVGRTYHIWTPVPCNKVVWPLRFKEQPLVHHEGPEFPLEVTESDTFVAHNADGFDRIVWEALGLPRPGLWVDTLPMARIAGYPGSLDRLGERFIGFGKSKAASRILSKTFKSAALPKPGDMAVIAQYNVADVLILEEIYSRVHRYSRPWYDAHVALNERGVGFDVPMARKILGIAEQHAIRSAAEIEALSGLKREDLTKRDKILAWVQKQGVGLDNLKRETVDLLLDDPEAFLLESEDDENDASSGCGSGSADAASECG